MIALIASFPLFVQSIAALCMVLGVLSFVVQIAMILRQRVRKQNDYWVKNILFALVCLVTSVFTCTLYFILTEAYLGILSGVLFFFGFLLSFIVGHIYKILPFLIWYEKFSPLVGKQKVPLLHQMIHTKMADSQTWMLFVAVGIMCSGVVTQIERLFFLGSVLLLSSLVLVALNALYAFKYKMKE